MKARYTGNGNSVDLLYAKTLSLNVDHYYEIQKVCNLTDDFYFLHIFQTNLCYVFTKACFKFT
jgi:hypothetical protein